MSSAAGRDSGCGLSLLRAAYSGGLVKSMLGIFASLGILIMYKEQYMIVDEGYVLDISDTVADLDWPPATTMKIC